MLDYADLSARLLLNVVSMAILLFGLYYPRYRHKETAITAALVNIFTFAVLSVLSSVQFSIAAGFGLFAILAMFSLRSEQISKTDVAYFFGSIALTVITSIQGTELRFVMLMLAVVLLAAYVIDHPRILRTASQMRVTLDTIPEAVAADPDRLNHELAKRLGVHVISARIRRIDYVTEIVEADVDFRTKE